MDRNNTKEKDMKVKFRPGDPRVPCFAILGDVTSELKLVNLEGGSSTSVKISDHYSLGIVCNNGDVFAVTWKEILKLHSDGTREHLYVLPVLDVYSQFVLFQKKIYIIQPYGKSMLCFDPADNSLTDELPRCGLGSGFCASATDDFICAMGGRGTKTRSMKFDPLRLKWEKKARMGKERVNAAAATLDGKIYVMGGEDHPTSVEYYNSGNNSWTEISNMNAGRRGLSACVDGNRLYAVGGDVEEENGFYQHSIEVYDKNQWMVVTKFQTKGSWIYSCVWPHGSHQPETRSGGNNFNNCSFNTTVNQVATGGEKNMSETKNIKGDVSTVVNAPDGQLTTGNENVMNEGAGNNFVAGPIDTALNIGATFNKCNLNVQGGDKATTAAAFHVEAQGTVNLTDSNIDVLAVAKGAQK